MEIENSSNSIIINDDDDSQIDLDDESLEYDRAIRRFHRLNCMMEALREVLSEENPARESSARVKLCLGMISYLPKSQGHSSNPPERSAPNAPEQTSRAEFIPRESLVEEASIISNGEAVGDDVKDKVRSRLASRIDTVSKLLLQPSYSQPNYGSNNDDDNDDDDDEMNPYAAVVQGAQDLESGCAAAEAAVAEETAEAERVNAEALRMESENMTRLLKLITEYKLCAQAQSDSVRVSHAQAQGTAAMLRMARLHNELAGDVYSPQANEALAAMHSLLRTEITAQQARLQAAQREYRKFKEVGLGLEEIAREYARVNQAIQNKRNALAQLDSNSSFG